MSPEFPFEACTSCFDGGELLTIARVGKVLAHAVAGGVMSKIQGGQFGSGFLSAGVAQTFAPSIGDISNDGLQYLAVAILGGTTSKLSGGKFENGAVTAVFARMFNDKSKHPVDFELTEDEITELNFEVFSQTSEIAKSLRTAIEEKNFDLISEITGIDIGWLKTTYGLNMAEVKLLSLSHARKEAGIGSIVQGTKIVSEELAGLVMPTKNLGKVKTLYDKLETALLGVPSRISNIQVYVGSRGSWNYSFDFYNVKIERSFKLQ